MKKFLTAVILAAAAATAQAAVVYNNGAPNASSGNETTQWIQAENFNIAAGAGITGAEVFLAGFGGIGAWDGTLQYYFFADAAGAPGAQLATGAAANLAVTNTGIAWCCGGNAFSFTFDLQSTFNAAAGTNYWFGIHASTNFNRDDIYWVTTNPTNGNGNESFGGTQNNWFNNGQEHAFNLRANAQVPEPASLLLFGLGLAGLALTRRRSI